MNSKTIFGFFLIAAGIFLFGYGFNASKSLVEQVSNTFLGRFSETTTWYMIGGLASAAAGFFLVMLGFRGKRG